MKAGKWARVWVVLLAALLALGMATGCSDDDDNNNDTAAPADTTGGGTTDATDDATDAVAGNNVNVAGDWNGTRSSDAGSTEMMITFRQDGSALTGSYQDRSGFAGTLVGTIDGDDITFVLTLTQGSAGDTWTFSGAANATGTDMNGTMRSEAGTSRIVATK